MNTLAVVICSVMVPVLTGRVADRGGDPIPTPVSPPAYIPGARQHMDASFRKSSQGNPDKSYEYSPGIYPGSMSNLVGIIRQTSQNNPDESYEYSYETANGIKVEERGIRSNLQDSPIISSGTFEYTAPDNTAIAVKYVANENGFLPEGSHLPIPPPIPAQIIRALEWNAAHPEPNTQ